MVAVESRTDTPSSALPSGCIKLRQSHLPSSRYAKMCIACTIDWGLAATCVHVGFITIAIIRENLDRELLTIRLQRSCGTSQPALLAAR
jgi:hypothetical protein